MREKDSAEKIHDTPKRNVFRDSFTGKPVWPAAAVAAIVTMAYV